MAYKPLAFIRRDFLTQTSYRFSFILSIVWMFVGIASSYFISRLLGTAVSPYLDSYNASYFEFALIGVAFYGFAYADSLSGTVRSY
ncbi:MAG: ABC transporter permease, partial [Chloroflexi bacterium]|nr:ABC transporter permease [Chloroflexota bacterium]